jgi:hypothetical protein
MKVTPAAEFEFVELTEKQQKNIREMCKDLPFIPPHARYIVF